MTRKYSVKRKNRVRYGGRPLKLNLERKPRRREGLYRRRYKSARFLDGSVAVLTPGAKPVKMPRFSAGRD